MRPGDRWMMLLFGWGFVLWLVAVWQAGRL